MTRDERTPRLLIGWTCEDCDMALGDDPSRQDLTNMVYDLPHVVEILVDGEDEGWRPTVVTVGFDDSGHRTSGDVLDIMRAAGWKPDDVTFGPFNRISFVEVDASE